MWEIIFKMYIYLAGDISKICSKIRGGGRGGRQTIKFLNLGTEAEKKRGEESVLQTSENQSV